MRIILHAGTPKTGTTALQSALFRHRDLLLERGVLYPLAGIDPPPEPKHQWMIGALMHDPDNFTAGVETALGEARPDTHTMILSTEGLFHRWWDFPPQGRAALRDLARRFPVILWVVFREPVSFIRSFYIQTLRNPRGLGPLYGLDMALEDMLAVPRFSVHLDYARYVGEVEECIGVGTVRPFRYGAETIIGDILTALGITDPSFASTWENRSLGDPGVRLLRQVNRSDMPVATKGQIVQLVEQIDALMDGVSDPLTIDARTIAHIRALAAPSLAFLAERYQLQLGDAVPLKSGVLPAS
ncbi:hypothetical protein [Azospirillum sp. B506]|uniref:hypothetical protein n=1 Tax=Azospirillum sp. B506 TaxID=137721 RepID=UPI00034B107C|nr:hypothetical protein [Azospirillum sp. B506]